MSAGYSGHEPPRVEPAAELRPLPGRFDRVVRRIAGIDEPPPLPATSDWPRAFALDVAHELRTIAAILRELRDVESGEFYAKPVRVVIDAQRPFYTFTVDAPAAFHAVKVDNPSNVTVELRFDGSLPTAGNSDERVPKQTGRVITREYDECSIGIDPAVIPAGVTPVFVTFYSRPLSPASYAFAP